MMDKAEFTAAVLDAEETLYRVAMTLLRDEHDAADAAQQAILRAWERLGTLADPAYFKTWLTRILINECKDLMRRRARLAPYEPELVESVPAPQYEDHSDLYTALTALDEKYRLPVVLHYLEGFKTREIAKMLGLPESTVKTRLRTARERLRRDLEGACFV